MSHVGNESRSRNRTGWPSTLLGLMRNTSIAVGTVRHLVSDPVASHCGNLVLLSPPNPPQMRSQTPPNPSRNSPMPTMKPELAASSPDRIRARCVGESHQLRRQNHSSAVFVPTKTHRSQMLYRSLCRFLLAAKAVICAGVASTWILVDSLLAPFQFLECPVNKRQGTFCHFGFCRIV